MRVFVTGGNGFIGKYVLSELSNYPVSVVALIRNGEKEHFTHCGAEIIRFELGDPPSNAFDLLGNPDVCIHLAWSNLSSYRSLAHFELDLPIHYRFLSSLVRAGLPALVVSGTCFEYGIQSGELKEETTTRPVTPYAFAKDTLRKQLEYLQANQPFLMTWLRLFYLHGKGQSQNSIKPQLEAAVKQGEKIFHMSGGEQLRDYLPVKDAAKYIVMTALYKADSSIMNICSGKPISVRRLVDNWIEINDWKIELSLGHYAYPSHEPMAFWGSRSRLDRFLKTINKKDRFPNQGVFSNAS